MTYCTEVSINIMLFINVYNKPMQRKVTMAIQAISATFVRKSLVLLLLVPSTTSHLFMNIEMLISITIHESSVNAAQTL